MGRGLVAPTAGGWRARLRALTWAAPLLSALWVLALPAFLVTTNVLLAFNSVSLYEYGFDKYEVALSTGISRAELSRIAVDIRDYFWDDRERLDTEARVRGVERPLFNEREIAHMQDVKALLGRVGLVQRAAGVYLAAFLAGGLLLAGGAALRRLGWLLLAAGAGTVAGVLLLGLVALVAFEPLFTLFHVVSFANDFWQLDPSRDYLVALFPLGFWSDATLLLAGATLLQGALAAGVGGLLAWRARGRGGGWWGRTAP